MNETVLFVSLPAVLGGSMRSLATTLRWLEGRCGRVVATPSASWLGEHVIQQGLADRVLAIPGIGSSRWSRPAAAARLAVWAVHNRRALAAVHANGLAEFNVAWPAALLARRPLVVWVHDGALTPWARRLVPWLARTPRTTLAAVSEVTAAMLREEAGVAAARICVVPNPIDPAEVLSGSAVPDPDKVRVGYLGLPSVLKGFPLLPDIASALSGAPVRFLVFSEPRTDLPETWARLEAIEDPIVEFHERATDVRTVYERCDIIVCPSRVESFGRVAVEAMLNGLPVVAADLPALREVIGDAGILFTEGDAASAAAAILELVRDGPRRAELGRAGRRLAARYQPGPIVDRLVSLYELQPV